MKKFNTIICLLVSILLLLAGCTDEVLSADKGTVRFSIGNSISKGIDSNISMAVDHYTLNGYGPNANTFSVTIGASEGSYTQDVYIGTWNFTATAYNADNVAIGSGSASATVKPGNNTVSIQINETEGQGTLKVIIEGVIYDDTYTLHLYTAEGGTEPIQDIDFVKSNGVLTVEKLLDNGFYAFDISSTNSLVNIPAIDSVRIVNGDTVTVTYTIIDSGNVTVSIKNEIIPTPSLSLSLSADTIAAGETVTATAVASNIDVENLIYLWLVDNEMVDQTVSNTYEFGFDNIWIGEHCITCIIINNENGIAWSDSAMIVGNENIPQAPAYLAIDPYDAVYCTDTTVTEVVIPETINGHKVKSIAAAAFEYCTQLTTVTIPDTVTEIGDGAFFECHSLTSITIPNSVTSIGDEAFYLCVSLGEITIPNSVTSIGNRAFGACHGLSEITIPNSVTSIGDSTFLSCMSLSSVTIPDSVTTIGEGAFNGCEFLSEITIPDSVTTIGQVAFKGCTALTEITIPDSVTSIGDEAFYSCSSLSEITIPDSVTSIGADVFSCCDNLESVSLGNGIKSLDCTHVYGSGFFCSCKALTSITIPNSVTSIGGYAFDNCTALSEITIPDSVTSIGNNAFRRCISLTEITIPDSVTSIGNNAFQYCSSLESINIGNGVKTIEKYAFEGCTSLKTVIIGNGIEEIDYDAFRDCSTIEAVFIDREKSEYADKLAGIDLLNGYYGIPVYWKGEF